MTFKEFYINEVGLVQGLKNYAADAGRGIKAGFNSQLNRGTNAFRRAAIHFAPESTSDINIKKMKDIVIKNIQDLIKNLDNSNNNFLKKLANSKYAGILEKLSSDLSPMFETKPGLQNQSPQTTQQTTTPTPQTIPGQPPKTESFLGGAAGAALGGLTGGPLGALYGAAAGHYGGNALSKGVNYMLPSSMQLRTHITLEKQLLKNLSTLVYMIENSKDPLINNGNAHGSVVKNMRAIIGNLQSWQKYYEDGGTGEKFGQQGSYGNDDEEEDDGYSGFYKRYGRRRGLNYGKNKEKERQRKLRKQQKGNL